MRIFISASPQLQARCSRCSPGCVSTIGDRRPRYCRIWNSWSTGNVRGPLFLTCADSRVVPNVLTSSGSGDLFTVRNLGNLVPPPGHGSESSVAATLEYAVDHLEVPSILVCGHTGCAAMHGLLDGGIIDGSLGRWLRWGIPSLRVLRDGHPVGVAAAEEGRNEVDQLSMVNVARQVEVIGRHSKVRDAVAAGRVQVSGLFLDIRTARLLVLDPKSARFVPVPDDQLLAVPPPVGSTADSS